MIHVWACGHCMFADPSRDSFEEHEHRRHSKEHAKHGPVRDCWMCRRNERG